MSYIPIPVPTESRAPEWPQQLLIALFVFDGLIIGLVGVVVIWAAAIRPLVIGESVELMILVMAGGVGTSFLCLACLAFASAWGLHRRRDWALTTSYITCAFQALFFPVGTVLSAFGWWVLSRTSFDAA